MKLFGREIGRKKDVSSIPAEVQDYYKSERRERTGLVWLLAAGTLVVTLLLAAGLFFGGRWAYRQLTDNTRNNGNQGQQEGNDKQGGETQSNDSAGTNNQANSGQTSSTNTETGSQAAQSTASSNGQTAGASTTPATGSNDSLIITGPTD